MLNFKFWFVGMFDIVKSRQIVGAIHESPASFFPILRAIRESPLRFLRINSVIIHPNKSGFVNQKISFLK